ncbi:hypothetical protein ADICYQ_5376 [Cyclobacterium qasimii M12-11B]|uniref:Uncharacterized protein n=2 Tax=Cyclobacterium qasimii TaxID=1350429 RepID=S7V5L5_9BACT|nr:hypothetical protein ADICYQ_5376 [Cyclobacterium qasimii M12-11B]GEO19669.1 hypothetical protein CQA01_02030 [Cyclobacterium qasimii]
MQELERVNPDLEKLKSHFQFPNGSLIEYDVNAPKDKWVIKRVDEITMDSAYDSWPLIDGEF